MNIRFRLHILKKLSFARTVNALKVLSSYAVSKLTKTPVHWGLPISIGIEPTTSCNLRCPECPSGLRSFTRPTGMLSKELFQSTIDQLSKTTTYLTFYFQGEPYLNKDFLDMVYYASGKGLFTTTSTNAHYLTEENAIKTINSGLDRLIISIDGTTQETYEQYRVGGILEKVLQGTKNIVAQKKRLKSAIPHIVFQYLVVRPNEHQLDDVQRLAKELGVDEVAFKTAQVYDYENGNELIPTTNKYARYKLDKDGKYGLKNSLANHCWKLWHSCVITWDGRVVPCCFDKDANYEMGSVKSEKFTAIWNDERYKNFRTKVLQSRKNIDICSNCSEGSLIWVTD